MATSDAEAASVAAAQMREDMVSAYEEAVHQFARARDMFLAEQERCEQLERSGLIEGRTERPYP